MTDTTLTLAELLAKAGDGDFLRAVAEAVVQRRMEADVDGGSDDGLSLAPDERRRSGSWRGAHDIAQGAGAR